MHKNCGACYTENLEAENAELRQQNEVLRLNKAEWSRIETNAELAKQNAQLRQRWDEAVKALCEYGRHRLFCRAHHWWSTSQECDCGLSDAVAHVEGEQK